MDFEEARAALRAQAQREREERIRAMSPTRPYNPNDITVRLSGMCIGMRAFDLRRGGAVWTRDGKFFLTVPRLQSQPDQ